MRTIRRRDSDRWALLAVAPDERTAEEWQRTLAEHGLPAEIRIGSPEAAPGGVSQWRLPYSPHAAMFSYPVYVRAHERTRARALLATDPQLAQASTFTRAQLIGALTVALGTVVLVVALIAARG